MKKVMICVLLCLTILTGCDLSSDKGKNNDDNSIGKGNIETNKDNTNDNLVNGDSKKIIDEVKNYILNGQEDKADALKFKWSKRFLNEVDIEDLYKDYLKVSTKKDDVQEFAKYITENAPISDNWQELFKKDVLDAYNEKIVSIKHLEGDLYQGNIMINGIEKAYVVVSARTGYYHGTSDEPTAKTKGKVQLYEGAYFDSRRYGEDRPNPYCEVVISNITETSFDFTVYEVEYTDEANSAEKSRKVIFLTNTATFIEEGTRAAFYGKDYTLEFTFPDNHKAFPVVTDISIKGFKPLDGKVFLNNGIPGHEFG